MIHKLLVEVVSPLILGGADPTACDQPPSLRAPSVRGQLRFWTRALGGEDMAAELWGDTEKGQRTRVLPPATQRRDGWLQSPQEQPLSPPTGLLTSMIPPGDRILLRFDIPQKSMVKQVQAVVWTWLHLGAIGRRSRRGYGSLVWLHTLGDLLEDWPRYRPTMVKKRGAFETHLQTGLERVREVFGSPGSGPRRDISIDTLATTDQIFVGEILEGQWAISAAATDANIETALRGRKIDYDSYCDQESKQLGSQDIPSPIRWRTHPAGPGKLRTVVVWFPVGYGPGEEIVLNSLCDATEYVRDTLGIEKSLMGKSIQDED